MKVLIIGPRFHTNQYQMVKTFLKYGHKVFFHAASLGATEDHSLIKPVRYRQSRLSLFMEKVFGRGGVNCPNYFPALFSYWKIIRDLKPDVAIIRDPQRFFSIVAASYASLMKAKIVFYTQENLLRYRNKTTRIRQELMIRLFKAAWMVPIKGEEQPKGEGLKHMYFVPLPIPIHLVERKNDIGNEIRILMIGKYNQKRKNHLLLIRAVNALKDKYKLRVTMVGECAREEQSIEYNKLTGIISDLGLADIIDLKKDVPYSQIGDLYSSHEIFVLPAVDEQYGISVTEALGYGMPVICTDTCGARFNVSNGDNGYVVKSNSLESLIDALESLIGNTSKRESMSRNSVKYVCANLSGPAFYKSFSQLVSQRFQFNCS